MAGVRNADVGQQVNVPFKFTDAQVNNGFVGLRQGVQTIALGGTDTTLILAGEAGAGEVRLLSNVLRVDPGGDGTKLILPAVADLSGIPLTIYNSADAAEELLVRNSGDTATVVAMDQGESGTVESDGTSYFGLGGSSGGGTDFGAGGLSADVIAESTAAAGVTVDGLKIKDGSIQSTPLTDPGNAGAIPVTASGVCPLVSAGAETRTIPDPTFVGQELIVVLDTDGGTVTVTPNSDFDQASSSALTLADAGDTFVLRCITLGGVKKWRLVGNDGCVLVP